MEPMFYGGTTLAGVVAIAVGLVGIVAGFAWIRRITSSDDDGPSNWRSGR